MVPAAPEKLVEDTDDDKTLDEKKRVNRQVKKLLVYVEKTFVGSDKIEPHFAVRNWNKHERTFQMADTTTNKSEVSQCQSEEDNCLFFIIQALK